MTGPNGGRVAEKTEPCSGANKSWLGRQVEHYGLHEYTEAKYIAVSW